MKKHDFRLFFSKLNIAVFFVLQAFFIKCTIDVNAYLYDVSPPKKGKVIIYTTQNHDVYYPTDSSVEQDYGFYNFDSSGAGADTFESAENDAINSEASEDSQGDFSIVSVIPDKGSIKGGELVTIKGSGFLEDDEVYFGDKKAKDIFYINENYLNVRTPSGNPGYVDVKVVHKTGKSCVLEKGFFYVDEFEVTEVVPDSGDVKGGEGVVIKGSGFKPPVTVYLNGRKAVNAEVISSNLISFITPPGKVGEAKITLEMGASVYEVEKKFFYYSKPFIHSVYPEASNKNGGIIVRIKGQGLVSQSEVFFGNKRAKIVAGYKGEWLDVKVPPQPLGLASVKVVTNYGDFKCENCFLYFDSEFFSGSEPSVLGFKPDFSDVDGGGECTFFVKGSFKDIRVYIGLKECKISGKNLNSTVIKCKIPPQNNEGLYPVTVFFDGKKFLLQKKFLYTKRLSVESAEPAVVFEEGGQTVVFYGKNFDMLKSISIGGIEVTDFSVLDKNSVSVKVPAGSPGFVDAEFFDKSGNNFVFKKALFYKSKIRKITGVFPGLVPENGGVIVKITGLSLENTEHVWFYREEDGVKEECEFLKVISDTEILCKTPFLKEGVFDVIVSGKNFEIKRKNALITFNSRKKKGGTSGGEINGFVTVTIREGGTGAPLEGAIVKLKRYNGEEFAGTTNSHGKITFSFEELVGPITITAYKEGYNAYSVMNFNAKYLTFYLLPKPEGGGGTPPKQKSQKFGKVSGKVIGVLKYIPMLKGNCEDYENSENSLCKGCNDDDECGSDFYCAFYKMNGGKKCLKKCVSDSDCPSDFRCFNVEAGKTACIPILGERETRCYTTLNSIYGISPDPSEYQTVDVHNYYEIVTKPGTIAVYCIGGIKTYNTGEFIPQIMGVKIGVSVHPDEVLTDQNVYLDIPLTGKYEVPLQGLPLHKNGLKPINLQVYLHLSNAGYIKLPAKVSYSSDSVIQISYVPEVLAGDLKDASYTFYGFIRPDNDEYSPTSFIYEKGVKSLKGGCILRASDDNVSECTDISTENDIFDMIPIFDNGIIAGGEHGALLYFNGSSWYPQNSNTDSNIISLSKIPQTNYFVYLTENSELFVFKNGEITKIEVTSEQKLRSVFAVSEDYFLIGGKGVIIEFNSGSFKKFYLDSSDVIVGFYKDGLNIFAISENGKIFKKGDFAWKVSQKLPFYTVVADTDSGFIITKKGYVYKLSGGFFELFKKIVTEDGFEFTSIGYSGQSGKVCASTLQGEVFCLANSDGEFEKVKVETNRLLSFNSVLVLDDGTVFAAGKMGTSLGPFMQYPMVVKPTFDNPLTEDDSKIVWQSAPGVETSYYYITLYSQQKGAFMSILANGDVNYVEIPKNLIPEGDFTFYITKAHSPSFNINHYKYSDLSVFDRTTWSTDYRTLKASGEPSVSE